MGKIFLYIVSIILIALIVSAVYPYVNRSFIKSDLKKAATYGTKHNIEETHRLLSRDLEERGLVYNPDNLNIEKDEYDTVSISLRYEDKISLLGIVLKNLEFDLYVREKNVKEYF